MVFYVSIFIFIFRFLEKEITIQNKPKTLRTTNWDFAPWDLYPKSDGPDYDFFLDQFLEHPDSAFLTIFIFLRFWKVTYSINGTLMLMRHIYISDVFLNKSLSVFKDLRSNENKIILFFST